ncbi:MAG TPA: PTS sugar transporter subunit IIA [Thermoanaerobaculia bacterium]|nr:PTS sugar transporter subunit IIA [Thermoanaerobaculia bacterium]
MQLEALTRPELILPQLAAADAQGVLRELADEIAGAGLVPDADELHQKLAERERLGSTAVGGGVAIPHCKLRGLGQAVVAIGRVEPGIDFGAADGEPVRAFFVVVSPAESPAEHLRVLSTVARWIKGKRNVEQLLALEDRDRLWELLGGGR